MKKMNIEQCIRNTIAQDTPDLFDKIMASPVTKLESEDYIVKSRPISHHRRRYRSITAVCTSMVLLIVICLGFMKGYPVYANDSIMYIDINPGIKIVTNISGKVTSLEGTNQDGNYVVSNISYKNKTYQEVLLESLQVAKNQGYITSSKENVVLVSVRSQNDKRGSTIKDNAVADIKTNLTTDNMSVIVYSQKITESSQMDALADEYHISSGKAQFIMSLVNRDPSLSIASLANLSLQELEALSIEKNIDLASIVDCNKEPAVDLAHNNTSETTAASTATTDDIVEPKQDTTTESEDSSSKETPTSTQPSNSSSSTSTEDNNEAAVPKTPCKNCDSNCSCPNCSSGCKPGCPDCDSNCPNSKNPAKEPDNNTGEAVTTEEEDEEIVEGKNTEDIIIDPPECQDEMIE